MNKINIFLERVEKFDISSVRYLHNGILNGILV